ncbi:hypothetical protein CPLU01_00887 [Colletotrichum plurivorum]|uniref:Uncharacterized protein n=1 Tax=Colletotrichum plurivorum TaxID=2175906 RepID=A0A8H6U5H4_9PEZI|nr:hypothetical protein CPLU01_00887 [Colletotrichum plurivorum]
MDRHSKRPTRVSGFKCYTFRSSGYPEVSQPASGKLPDAVLHKQLKASSDWKVMVGPEEVRSKAARAKKTRATLTERLGLGMAPAAENLFGRQVGRWGFQQRCYSRAEIYK